MIEPSRGVEKWSSHRAHNPGNATKWFESRLRYLAILPSRYQEEKKDVVAIASRHNISRGFVLSSKFSSKIKKKNKEEKTRPSLNGVRFRYLPVVPAGMAVFFCGVPC